MVSKLPDDLLNEDELAEIQAHNKRIRESKCGFTLRKYQGRNLKIESPKELEEEQ